MPRACLAQRTCPPGSLPTRSAIASDEGGPGGYAADVVTIEDRLYIMTPPWSPDFLARSPMLEPLRVHASTFGDDCPGLGDLQRLLDRRNPPVRNAGGMPLRLVPHGRRSRAFEDGYEARLYLKSELQVREGDWHDLFNVLVWLAFPLAKAALNARHYSALKSQTTPNRGPVQDALTLFDEGGVIVASSDKELLACVQGWRWKELFWGHRVRLAARMRFYLFGHALYEKALHPFIGVTGRGVLVDAGPEMLQATLVEQLAAFDSRVAAHISAPETFAATRELAVVPVLGVPGWCGGNERESFYDDTGYFRAGRTAAREGRDS
jgi:hypothetical protein